MAWNSCRVNSPCQLFKIMNPSSLLLVNVAEASMSQKVTTLLTLTLLAMKPLCPPQHAVAASSAASTVATQWQFCAITKKWISNGGSQMFLQLQEFLIWQSWWCDPVVSPTPLLLHMLMSQISHFRCPVAGHQCLAELAAFNCQTWCSMMSFWQTHIQSVQLYAGWVLSWWQNQHQLISIQQHQTGTKMKTAKPHLTTLCKSPAIKQFISQWTQVQKKKRKWPVPTKQ